MVTTCQVLIRENAVGQWQRNLKPSTPCQCVAWKQIEFLTIENKCYKPETITEALSILHRWKTIYDYNGLWVIPLILCGVFPLTFFWSGEIKFVFSEFFSSVLCGVCHIVSSIKCSKKKQNKNLRESNGMLILKYFAEGVVE